MKKLGSGANKKWRLTYHPLVVKKDIPNLDNSVFERVKFSIEDKLLVDPFIFGSPLRGVLKLSWKLRVGDWRVIYDVNGLGVFIWAIGHRRDVYKIASQRL